MIECGEREEAEASHSSSASTHLLLRRRDPDPEKKRTSCLGDQSAQHGRQYQCTVREKSQGKLQLENIYAYTRLTVVLNSG